MKTHLVKPISWLVAAATAMANQNVWAHEGPEHEIEELTDLLKIRSDSSDLLLQRAIEYRVLGQMTNALKDLEEAARIDPLDIKIQRELSKVQFWTGKTNEAVETVSHAIATKSNEPDEKAGLLMIRSQFLRARGEYKKAVADAHQAIQLHDGNPEWYLHRSNLQELLQQNKERIQGIDEGIQKTGAGVLLVEKVAALLQDKQFTAALSIIEPELESSRIRSSWLIRRAQARLGLGQTAAAKEDLHEALREIEPRINLPTPDVSLLLDRALAHELLEDRSMAKHYYEQARDAGADAWVKEKIKALKEALDKKAESPKAASTNPKVD